MDNLIPIRPYWNINFDNKLLILFIKMRPSDFYGEDVVFDFAIEQITEIIKHMSLIYLVHKIGDDFIKAHYNPPEKYYIEFDVLKVLTNDIKKEITKVYPDFFNEK